MSLPNSDSQIRPWTSSIQLKDTSTTASLITALIRLMNANNPPPRYDDESPKALKEGLKLLVGKLEYRNKCGNWFGSAQTLKRPALGECMEEIRRFLNSTVQLDVMLNSDIEFRMAFLRLLNAYREDDVKTNICFGRPSTSSTCESSQFLPEYSTDGKNDTRWASEWRSCYADLVSSNNKII